jgi:uncharacterized protein YggE
LRSVRSILQALLLLVVLLPSTADAQQPPVTSDSVATVTASGEGLVQAVPDRAWITITAESRASNPREAQRRNTEAMTPVLDKLKAAGIPAEAIRTVAYDLQQEWDYVNERRISRGYLARNSVEVRVDSVDRVGELLEIAVGSGATSVGGIRFDLKDQAKLEREALRLAVADARARAEAMAGGAGRAVERILRVDEQGVTAPPMPVRMYREAQLAASDAAAPPISAGQMDIRARVVVTVVLK